MSRLVPYLLGYLMGVATVALPVIVATLTTRRYVRSTPWRS